MLVLQKGLILPVPMYGGSYFFIQPRICEDLILWAHHILHNFGIDIVLTQSGTSRMTKGMR